jgi:dephospho-CoA kinase
MQGFYDKIILVTAPEGVKIERIMQRDSIGESEVLARMKNQWDDKKKIPISDFLIENVQIDETVQKVKEVHGLLLDHSTD